MIADKTKHIHFQKERKFPFLLPISILPLSSQSAQPFQPLATWAEACQAIPVVSAWVMNTVRRGYSLQFGSFGPVAGGFDIAQDPPPQPLRLPGAQGQLCQEYTVTQPTSIVPGYSYRLGADDSYCLSGASHHNSASRGFLQVRHRPSAQSFPEDAGPYGSGFAGTSAGSASYATHPVLVETEGSSSCLASRTPLLLATRWAETMR